jgi:hypothetical protein
MITLIAQDITGPGVDIAKILIGTLGGAGVAVWAAFLIFNKLIAQVDKKDAVYEKRIEALETTCAKLLDDTKGLNKTMQEVQTEFLSKAVTVISDNTIAFNRLSEKLLQDE